MRSLVLEGGGVLMAMSTDPSRMIITDSVMERIRLKKFRRGSLWDGWEPELPEEDSGACPKIGSAVCALGTICLVQNGWVHVRSGRRKWIISSESDDNHVVRSRFHYRHEERDWNNSRVSISGIVGRVQGLRSPKAYGAPESDDTWLHVIVDGAIFSRASRPPAEE